MKKYLEYKDEKSHKFWQIEHFETSFMVTYGKVGSKGQSKTKEFDNEDDMLDARAKLIEQKLKKGYKSLTAILVEQWDDEIYKIAQESAEKSSRPIEKIQERLKNTLIFNIEFKMNKTERDKLTTKKVQGLVRKYQQEHVDLMEGIAKKYLFDESSEENNENNITYLEYKDEKSHKFWKVEVEESSFTVNFGKVGTKGEVRLFEVLDNKQIVPQVEKLINQKLKKGYQEVAIPQEKPKTEKSKTNKAKKSNSNEIDYFEELVKFNEEHGGETYAQSFWIVDDEEDFFETWLDEVSEEKVKEYSDALEIFANADGTGAHYAFWFTDGNTDKNKAPIIYYGSEGAIIVLAENIKDLIKMLSFGAECMNGSFYHYIDGEDEDDDYSFYEEFKEHFPNHLAFREWMKNTLNIEPVSLDGLINDYQDESEEVNKLKEKAKQKIKKAFDKWQYQFYKNWEAEEEQERIELYKKYEENKKKLLAQVAENPSADLYLELAENEISLNYKDIDEKIHDQRKAFLEQALALDKNNIECLKELASSYQYANPQKAIELYNRLIPLVDNPVEYYADIARTYQENEDYEEALSYYTKAILAGESGWDGAYQRYIIDICDEIKDKDGLDVLEEIAKQKPTEDTYKVLYIQHFKEKKYDKSLEYALRYIDISDEQSHNFVKIGENFLKKELYKEALTIFENILNDKKDYWTSEEIVVNAIGLCHLRIKPQNIGKALDAFKKAYQINNNENAIHQNIRLCGTIYINNKEYEKAITVFEYCINNNFLKDTAFNNIVACYFQREEYKKAFENALNFIEHGDETTDNFRLVGEKFFNKGMYVEALALFEKIINNKKEFEDKDAITVNAIGLCHLRMEPVNVDEALEAFKKAYEITTNDVAIHGNIILCGNIYMDMKEYEKSIAVFEYCISNNIVKDIAFNNIGACYFQQAKYKQALGYFEKAYNENPENEKYKESVEHIEKLLEEEYTNEHN